MHIRRLGLGGRGQRAARRATARPLLVAAWAIGAVACSVTSDDVTESAGAHYNFLPRYLTIYASDPDQDIYYTERVGGPTTLAEWRAKYMPDSEPVVRSYYRNARELGFWREMVCTKAFHRGGTGGCAVTNWSTFDAKDSRQPDSGTVAMWISAEGFVQFRVFAPADQHTGTATASRFALLDTEGPKVVPHVCVNCHGGTVAPSQFDNYHLTTPIDVGSVFREFEPSILEPCVGPDAARCDPTLRPQAEEEWYALNQAVLAANETLRSEADGGLPGVDHAKKGVADHIRDLYAGLGEPSSHPTAPFSKDLADPELMPPSWRAADEPSKALWTRVVNPYCMECHRLNQFDWSNYRAFAYLRRGGLLGQYVHNGPGAGGSPLPMMPQSQLLSAILEQDTGAVSVEFAWSTTSPPGH